MYACFQFKTTFGYNIGKRQSCEYIINYRAQSCRPIKMQKFSVPTKIHSTRTFRSEFTDQKVEFLFKSRNRATLQSDFEGTRCALFGSCS